MSENNHRKQSLTYGQRLESGPVRQRPCAPCWSQWHGKPTTKVDGWTSILMF